MSSQIWEKLEKEKQAELFLSRPILGDTNLSGGARSGVGLGLGMGPYYLCVHSVV